MDNRLQVVADWIEPLIVYSKPEKNISYSINVSNADGGSIQFIALLWNSRFRDILKSHYIKFDIYDTDISIASKMVQIQNIINREINPFEEKK